VDQFLHRACDPDRKVETRLEQGSPGSQILEVAKREAADLIVMGTHGRAGARRLVLGSVAENVVRLAPCPVLTVRSTPSAQAPPRWARRRSESRILYATHLVHGPFSAFARGLPVWASTLGEGAVDGGVQFGERERLREVPSGSGVESRLSGPVGALGRPHDRRDPGLSLPDMAHDIEAVHPTRKADVGDDQIGRLRRDRRQCLRPRVRDPSAVPEPPQESNTRFGEIRFVFHDQDARPAVPPLGAALNIGCHSRCL
jgi:hypothetical protein